jgi:hypothetical protein
MATPEAFVIGAGLERTLPSSWYLRDDVFALEREHIFYREWLCVAREEELPKPGDHRVLDVLGQSVLLVRNGAGALRAFYNVCRHRGHSARIAAASESRSRQTCSGTPNTAEKSVATKAGRNAVTSRLRAFRPPSSAASCGRKRSTPGDDSQTPASASISDCDRIEQFQGNVPVSRYASRTS